MVAGLWNTNSIFLYKTHILGFIRILSRIKLLGQDGNLLFEYMEDDTIDILYIDDTRQWLHKAPIYWWCWFSRTWLSTKNHLMMNTRLSVMKYTPYVLLVITMNLPFWPSSILFMKIHVSLLKNLWMPNYVTKSNTIKRSLLPESVQCNVVSSYMTMWVVGWC